MKRALLPVYINARLIWLEFKLSTLNPLAPQLPALLAEQAQLRDERNAS